MLQRISLVLNIILTIAVGILFYLHFSGTSKSSDIAVSAPMKLETMPQASIVYVNIDTLLEHYDYIKETRKALEKEADTKQRSLENQYMNLQKQAEDFRAIAERLSPEEAQNQQGALMQKEQTLMQEREVVTQELMKKEQDLNLQLHKSITEYLSRFKAKMPFNFVLSYTTGGGILYAKDSLEITNEVIEGLNAEYKSKKTEKK